MPRIRPIEKSEAHPDVRQIYERIEGLGGRPNNFLKTVAHSPQLAKELVRWGIVRRGPLIWQIDRHLRELIQIKVSLVNACRYCVDVHKAVARTLGVPAKLVENLENPISTAFSDKELVAIEYAEQVTKDARRVSDELFSRLKMHFDDRQIVELTTIIGLFNWFNRFVDALQVEPDPENFQSGVG